MVVETKTAQFTKTVSCPSSNTLLSYRLAKLDRGIATLVTFHLRTCEFCRMEIELLAFYPTSKRTDETAPEIPMNLRILAESILNSSGS